MVSYGGSAWFPFEGGRGGAWIPSDGGAPCIISDRGGARNPSDGGVSHGLCGKASYDPAAMIPSYGPHRLHPPARHRSSPYDPPADARPRLATIPAKGHLFSMGHRSIPYHPLADASPRAWIPAKGDIFSMDHHSIPYHPPADARPRAWIPAKGDIFSMGHRSIPYHPPADAHPRTINQSASIPAKGPNADLFSMDHYYYPALISAMGPNADLFSMDHYYGIPYQISAKGPNADLFSMDHYYGQRQDWDDGDDDCDDPDRQPTECRICNRESEHTTLDCPFMVLSRQLDVLMRTPEEEVSYYYRYMEDDNTNEWTGGCGLAFYLPPGQRSVECCAADAMMLHKDGMNLVRITGFSRDVAEPELLYKLFNKIGPLTNVIVFPDHALAFVNFVSVEAARTAIKWFTGSGFGHIMWATEKPY